MAEPSATAPAQARAAERDALLATKLHLPGSRPGQVPRPRLTERLDHGVEHGLVLVCAPAGYGKTALLAEWAQRCPPRTAWLSLDSGDNDPARFWRHAVAAMDRVRPGLGGRLDPLLGPPAPASFEPLVTTLINELATGPGDGEVVLILDDYHVIESPAGTRVGRVLAGASLGRTPPGAGQPRRPAAGAGAAARPRAADRTARR